MKYSPIIIAMAIKIGIPPSIGSFLGGNPGGGGIDRAVHSRNV
ncbi:hypothetical protein [Flavobacterium sp. TAB 87]|nr:hypothetical protein [Flavobacterium sp. TAB 87]KVV15720.1 hypothetical protein AP058_00752 [Flavobacterium sp. TAB 87]